MNSDITKTIIRIIQDYCFENDAPLLNDKFAISLSNKILALSDRKELTLPNLRNVAKKRRDYFIANDLDCTLFCKGLYRKIIYELDFITFESFFDSIKRFKYKMENGNARDFIKTKTSEGMLRSTLNIYLDQESFCEARAGAGNNDIVVPSEKVVIETKLWDGIEYYNSGLPELYEYLRNYNYRLGYYIVFDYNKNDNPIIKSNGEMFSINYKNKDIHVFLIRMNEVRPSQKYKAMKLEKN